MDSLELSAVLHVLISTIHKEMRKQISLVCAYSMTELQTISLLISNNTLLPSQLASLTRVKMQSMSQILKKLENDGIIQRNPSQEDKRKVYISLTQFGEEAVKKVYKSKNEWLQKKIDETLDSKEKKALEDALPILKKLIEKV